MGAALPYVNLGAVSTVLDVSLGEAHTCAVLTDNTLKCWGKGDKAQTGQGDVLTKTSPVEVNLNGRLAAQVACGRSHTCVVLTDKSAYCFGSNSLGQHGANWTFVYGCGNTFPSYYNDMLGDHSSEIGANLVKWPVQAGAGVLVDAISAGGDVTCILSSGRVKCFGNSTAGATGYGSTINTGGVTVSSRYTPYCGSSSSEVYVAATSNFNFNPPFVDLGSSRTAVSVNVYEASVCALLDNGRVRCW